MCLIPIQIGFYMSSKIYTKYSTYYKKRGTDINSKLNSIAEEIFSGISTVKAFA